MDKKLKPTLSAKELADETTRAVSTYNALLETYPNNIMDESWLPADKQTMIKIFKMLWLADTNKMYRTTTEELWRLLSHFQPGIGGVPIDLDVDKGNPTTGEVIKRMERADKWLKLAVAEGKKYEHEIMLWKRSIR
jgi:hypothetical protein